MKSTGILLRVLYACPFIAGADFSKILSAYSTCVDLCDYVGMCKIETIPYVVFRSIQRNIYIIERCVEKPIIINNVIQPGTCC